MSKKKAGKIVSILMESPLYVTLSLEERSALVARIEESYPCLFREEDEEVDVGYEASWRGIVR
jgi:hypothetical protein